jgi:hypothetical protein
MKLPVLSILLASLLTSAAWAQGNNPSPVSTPPPGGSSAPIYKITKGRELTIPINLWGFVGSPGHYEVPSSTTLVELLSYAGGPAPNARLVDIRIIHADTADENRVRTYNLENFRDGDMGENPLLVPGDTIIVGGKALDVFFQAVGIVTNIMVIVTALINFISFTTKR